MREIKVRAWDKDQERFRTDLVRDEAGRVWCWNMYVRGYATQMNEQRFEWIEYTGLKDKNGKEIYEGDVIEWQTDKPNHKDRLAVEYWIEGGGCIKTVPFINSTSEIIGNIYENPYLLIK